MNAGGAIVIQDGRPGEFTLDTAMLADRFGWSAAEFHDLMRRQLVTSRVERGADADRGSWRLSVRCGNRQWQAIVGADGTIVHETMDFVAAQKPRSP